MKSFLALFQLCLCAGSCIAQVAATPPLIWTDSELESGPVKRIKVGADGDWAKASLIRHPEPEYPAQAEKKKIQGTVRLRAIVSRTGNVRRLELVSGDRILGQSAIDAVRKWKYRPTLLNGEAVEVDTVVDVVFQLKGKKPGLS